MLLFLLIQERARITDSRREPYSQPVYISTMVGIRRIEKYLYFILMLFFCDERETCTIHESSMRHQLLVIALEMVQLLIDLTTSLARNQPLIDISKNKNVSYGR